MTEICEKHRAFAAEWESLGRPALEYFSQYDSVGWRPSHNPAWVDCGEYRFSGDRHWALRKRWLDSEKALPIETWIGGNWHLFIGPNIQWNRDAEYREAAEGITITDVSPERLQINNEFDEQQGYLNEIGNGYIEFGTALKNPETTIADLVPLANRLGLALQLRIVGDV